MPSPDTAPTEGNRPLYESEETVLDAYPRLRRSPPGLDRAIEVARVLRQRLERDMDAGRS